MKAMKLLFATTAAFTKGGSVFKGWAGDNGRRYDDGVLVFNAAEAGKVLTLAAIWQ